MIRNPMSPSRLPALLVALLLAALPALAPAQSFTAPDRAEIAAFRLDANVLKRMQALTHEGMAMHLRHSRLDVSQVHSIDDMAAQMTAGDSRMKALLARHGFTPHQFVVANLALVNAATAANAQANPGMAAYADDSPVAQANLQFYEAHRDAINAMMQEAAGGG